MFYSVDIIKSFKSVYDYEIFEYLFGFINVSNEQLAIDLIYFVLYGDLKTPKNEYQQTIQLNIVKKLASLFD